MTATNDLAIDVLKVSKTYKSTPTKSLTAIREVSFSAKEGEFISIVGRSGCGKSTLLKMVAGLLPATSGSIRVFGSEVDEPLDNVGFVFQHPLLLPWRNTLDNVLLPAELIGQARERYVERARKLIETVGLTGFEHTLPRGLSIGMQQRVSVARALLLDPPILLLDEPFAALDELTREEMSSELLRVVQEVRKTVLFVTHSIPEAVMMGDRVLLLSERPAVLKLDLRVRLPRPRDATIRTSEAYLGYCEELRSCLGVGRASAGDPSRSASTPAASPSS